jgi:hypothetical protein
LTTIRQKKRQQIVHRLGGEEIMTTNATTVGFKLARIQEEIIELEHKYAVITEEDRQKLQKLRQIELSLRQNYDIN